MKNFLFAFAATSLLLTSCGKDDDNPKPKPQDPPVNPEAIVLGDINQNRILEDRIADPNLPDYLVNQNISVAAELTIRPGVVIAFAEDVTMLFEDKGAIFARGEADKKIRFIGKLPQKGYWTGLDIYSINSGNELTYTEILHAGSKALAENIKANIFLHDRARLSVKNSLISQSGGYGMFMRDGSNLISFAGNTISNNTEAPLKMPGSNVPKLDAATAYTGGNGRNVIEITPASWITGTSEVVWPAFNDNTPYRFLGSTSVQTGWKLMPGTTIEFAPDQEFEVATGGYLNAVGTAAKKIVITGVDKTVGSWKGFIVYSRSSSNVLEHTEVKYAGGLNMLSGVKAAVTVTDHSSLDMRNSAVTNSGGYGIHVNGNGQVNSDIETANTFTANASQPVIYTQ